MTTEKSHTGACRLCTKNRGNMASTAWYPKSAKQAESDMSNTERESQ
jgi:hypothetical protein